MTRLVALLFLAGLIAGCADEEAWSESEVERRATEWYDLEFPGKHEVDCPDGMPREDGAEMECTLTTGGKSTVVRIHVEGTSKATRLQFGPLFGEPY